MKSIKKNILKDMPKSKVTGANEENQQTIDELLQK